MDAQPPIDYDVRADRGSSIILHVDKSLGRQFLTVLWFTAFISAVAAVGLIATCFFIYKNIGYTAVLEYDLMDLRAKVGEAHENTPKIETDEAE